MKRTYLVALALALLPGLAIAQNINRSIQGAQDPRGPIGWDVSNAMYFPGHINAFGQSPITSITTCGGSVLASGSTDVQGKLNVQQSTCIITFGVPFNAPPTCILTPSASTTIPVVSMSATASIALANLTTSTSLNYICIGNQ